MKTILVVAGLVLGCVVALVVAFVLWRLWATHSGDQKAYLDLAQRIAPVEERLARREDPNPADLERFAQNRETRKVLYDALEHHNKLHLFPQAYRTFEAMAEADLVVWLCHPNELAAPPDEIELMATVAAPGEEFAGQSYLVFRYRTLPPHWAASDGWLAGVAGPYAMEGPIPSSAPGTFSRFEAFDSRTPEDHVRETHQQLAGKF